MAYISKKTTVNGVKPIGSNLFGTCSTASSTAQKDVTMADFDVLVSGVTIHVYFTHENTASNPTLKVGSTSAVAIKCNGASDGVWEDGAVISFTYNGANWVQNDAIGSGGGVTYSISANGDTVTLTGSDGSTSSATVADNDTTYGISISGNTLSLVEGGSGTQVTLPNDNTTYTISVSGHTLTLTPSSGTAQTVILPDDNTTYELERNLETITHMLYVNMDGIGYFPDEDNLVINNDGYDYLYNHENSVYIVDANGNDIANISNVDLCHLPPTEVTWTLQFGQYLVDYFATATEYRLKINGQLTQKIRKQVYYYDLQETIGGYDSVTAEDWYIDVNEGYIHILTTGVVVGDHNTIDLVGSDGTTTSVAIKAIDIGALPTARWQLNSVTHDGYIEAPGSIHPNCAWATDSNGNPSWKRAQDFLPSNTASNNGYVTKGEGQSNKVWKTDENGNPDWRDESGSDHIELTQAEYDALTQEEKNNGSVYFITDGIPKTMIVNDSVPIGAIQSYAGASAPSGWLICDGSAVSRTTYSELFEAIGTRYGSGDGSTTFNVPDLRGKVMIGVSGSHALASSGGEETHKLVLSETPSHTHNVTASFTMRGTDYNDSAMLWGNTGTTVAKTTGTGNKADTVHQVNGAQQLWQLTLNRDTTSKGSDGSHNNMQPYLTVNAIIKAKDHTLVQADVVALLDKFYPVGAYLETSDANYDPNVDIGGTWLLVSSKDAYIVEEGTEGVWTYRKWSDGTAECWGRTDVASHSYTANGGYFAVSESLPNGLFATTPPIVVVSGKIATNGLTDIGYTSADSTTRVQTYLINRNTSAVTQTGNVYWIVRGKWTNTSETYYRWHRTA